MRMHHFERLGAGFTPPVAGGDDTLVSFAQLHDLGVGFSRVHLRRLIAAGQFPRAVQVSANRVCWRLRDVKQWKASRPLAPMPKTLA